MRLPLAILFVALTGTASAQQEAPYVDDRSSASALVRSLYSAINRQEYARAWSYYGEKKPQPLKEFAAGYKDTKSISVLIGAATSEGAAGSVYYSVPVAIQATNADGSEHTFAGCYTARLANPSVQAEEFQPMHLESGVLKPSDRAPVGALPKSCGKGEPVAADPVLEQAKASFAASYAPICAQASSITGLPDEPPGDYALTYKAKTDKAEDPDKQARLISFECGVGAYNATSVWYLWDEANGLRPLQFASPTFDVDYENPDAPDSKVRDITTTGFTADTTLVNAEFDPATKTLRSMAAWRGLGDAYSSGTWLFRDGDFALVRFDVDATYNDDGKEPADDEVHTLVDYDSAP